MAASSTSNAVVSSSNPETVRSRLSLFSDLTPLERGEISSSWKEKCQLASCVGLLCLSLLAICAGILVLTLLPGTPALLGVAFIALGSVLLVTSALLYCSTRPSKKVPIQQVNIQDLQTQLHCLLASTDARGLAEQGFDPNGDPRLIIQEREKLLATFDRDLRKKEVHLYRLLSSDTENRHEALSDLSEFREMQEHISEELELLYRCYNQHLTGALGGVHRDERVLALYQERDLQIQELSGIGIEKSNQEENIVRLQSVLNTLTQRIRGIEHQLSDDTSRGLQDEDSVTTLQPLLQEQNTLLAKLAQAYNTIITLSIREESLTRSRMSVEKEIQGILESASEQVTFNREYKEKYLRSAGTINQLTNNLREKEATLLSLITEIEALSEEVARLRDHHPNGIYSQEDIDGFHKTIASRDLSIDQLQEQLVRYRNLIEEAAVVNRRISQWNQEKERQNLQLSALEQREQILTTKIQALQVELDKCSREEQHLRKENNHLKDLVSQSESGTDSTTQIEAFQREIRAITSELNAVVQEKADLSEACSVTHSQLTESQLRYNKLKEEILAKDEEVDRLKIEIERLRREVEMYKEDMGKLQSSLVGETDLKSSMDILRREIERQEQEILRLNSCVVEASVQNHKNVGLLQQSTEEKEKLLLEIQDLRARYAQEKANLEAQVAQLQQTLQDRHLEHTEEVSRVQAEKLQLENLLRDAQKMAGHGNEGAMQMLVSQLISLSSTIKQRKKSAIQHLEFAEMLAFCAPRFFGYIGADISCNRLRPGVFLEAELPEDATETQKQEVVQQRCLREWLLALLGSFSLEQIETLSKKAEQLIQASQGQLRPGGVFDALADEFPDLRVSSGMLNAWLTNCYGYVTQLECFNDYIRWSDFLVLLLQKMHRGTGGMLENLSEEEEKFFKVISNFSGKLPLVLGSIGHGAGTTPGSANPLGDCNFANLGNITWGRLERIVEGLLVARSNLSGPAILEMSDICESVVRTTTQVYTGGWTQKYQAGSWIPPKDI
ncbi:inclusion membrane protein [Chlamydia felis Fe/C-56]|uniref:Inclusion membrane protein n=1 Tax=Chlamydia felis (strain Fe/C-56) TaxID=264202 RepID=Q253B5_CHLFF|nr:membrane protein [Chlamydia felis]BAE81623.1 inclusion membrane protein [Chlamydia felis Fe/C-56]